MKGSSLKVAALLLGLLAGGAAGAELIPISAWIHDPVIDSVRVSPDGSRLAALTLSDVNAPPDVTVWRTTDLSAEPVRFRPRDVKARAVFWLNDDRLMVIGRQKFDIRTGGRTTKWYREKVYLYDGEGKAGRELFKTKEFVGANLFNRMPRQPDKVLVWVTNQEFSADIYELDLNSYNAKRVYRSASDEAPIGDLDGSIRAKQSIKGRGDDIHILFTYKHPETGKWEEHHRLYAGRREGMVPVAFDMDGRRVYMQDNTGLDKAVIRAYDLIDRTLGKPLFGGGTVEASGVLQASNPVDFGQVIGFVGFDEGVVIDYHEPKRRSIQQRLENALPTGSRHSLVSSSDDLTMIVVRSSGPREPGLYHLLVNGSQLVPLGRSFPHLVPEKLADTRFVSYPARDGLEIPGFLTLPQGAEGPLPAVVMPHGGPWARDFLGWDLWAQFLANRGYAVLQPQYRGSEGWGQALWRAGDREWGQKMQDDKDDGARWLVEQGIADPDRIAIYGYSYGGYAAMAASVRPNSPYQCAVAGAGLSELRTFDKITYESPFNREYQNPTIAGLSPIDHVKQVAMPVYLFHGDRDQRVPIEQSRKFASALKRAGKQVKYEEITDLWHSYPWWPQHHLAILSSLEDYLRDDCGPGGL
ncbi:MAG: prolyl oligopeptidase family serine peptidase [Gammaproteobacteria bacterium]|nr:prolyl oligopeptidase family serine peptidase [Gammaproteobacteria bacterium]